MVFLCALISCNKEEGTTLGICVDGSSNCACGLAIEDNKRFIVGYCECLDGRFSMFEREDSLKVADPLDVDEAVFHLYGKTRQLSYYDSWRVSREVGDTSYFAESACLSSAYGSVLYGNDIVGFSVFCDRQYDERHEAGGCVDDCFQIGFYDPYAYVVNGYALPEDPHYSIDSRPNVFVCYTDTLSHVDFCSHPHILYAFDLSLSCPPARTDTFTFTGRTVMSDSTVFEGVLGTVVLAGR